MHITSSGGEPFHHLATAALVHGHADQLACRVDHLPVARVAEGFEPVAAELLRSAVPSFAWIQDLLLSARKMTTREQDKVMMPETERYRIELDGRWSLTDLSDFPYLYNQVYALLYALERREEAPWEVADVFASYPWAGGYSAINFYRRLASSIPREHRPTIQEIRYASPGWIELGLFVLVAINVRRIVSNIIAAGREINSFYNEIYKGMKERRMLGMDVQAREIELDKERLAFVEESSERLTKLLGLPAPAEITQLTGNPFVTLKIILSLIRRTSGLAAFESKGKLKL